MKNIKNIARLMDARRFHALGPYIFPALMLIVVLILSGFRPLVMKIGMGLMMVATLAIVRYHYTGAMTLCELLEMEDQFSIGEKTFRCGMPGRFYDKTLVCNVGNGWEEVPEGSVITEDVLDFATGLAVERNGKRAKHEDALRNKLSGQ